MTGATPSAQRRNVQVTMSAVHNNNTDHDQANAGLAKPAHHLGGFACTIVFSSTKSCAKVSVHRLGHHKVRNSHAYR